MKKTTKLALFVGLVLLTCALMFTACDSGNKSQTPSGTNDITTTVEETTEHTCSFGEWMTIKEATCTDKGELERLCVCGDKETQSLDTIAHVEVVDAAVAPTCTATGLTEGKHCSVCNTIIVNQEILAATHTWKNEYEFTDTTHWNICNSCGKKSEENSHTLDKDGLCAVCGIPVTATKGIVYDISIDGTYAEVIGYEGTATKIRISSEYNGLPVKTIYNNAFANAIITEVIIPSSVISIGDFAFAYCYYLNSVVLPNTIIKIGTNAFMYCPDTLFNVDNGCKYIDTKDNPYFALINTTNKNHSTYVISQNTKVIGDYAFCGCTRLTSINIPDGVVGIGSSAFNGCASLQSIIIPDSVIYLGDRALQDCENLTSAEISKNIDRIDVGTFYDCQKLTQVVIGNKVSSIGVEAFMGCVSLNSITIGNSVTTISEWAFGYCDNLQNILFVGSKEEWENIEIADGNWPITNNDNIQYNCTTG